MASPPNIPDSSVPGLLAQSQPPEAWIYDRDPANGIARATFNGEVYAQTINSPAAGVSAFNGRTGSVTLDLADVEAAGGAPLASPALSGAPTAPTQASGTSNTSLATTAFVQQAVQQGAGVTTFNGRSGAVQLTLGDVTSVGGAPLASPALSGSPTAPTPVVTDNSSLLATTAYVNNWGAQNTVLSFNGRRGAVALTLADVESVGGAPIASPSFTGVPVVPTAAPGTSSGQAASCAFVENAITAGVSGVASFNGRTGAVSLTTADVTTAGGAPSLSPVLTGTPTAPTAVAGTNTGQLATCAFVETAIGSIAPIVNSFNGRNGTVTLTLGDVTGVGGAPLASPAMTGVPTVPTAPQSTNTTQAASCAFVEAAIASVAGVSSFNTRQGAVTFQASDITGAGGALLASPAFTGTPTVGGAAIATQPYVTAQLGNYLPLVGGTLTGGLAGTAANFSGAVAGSSVSASGNVNCTNAVCSNGVFVGGGTGPNWLNNGGSMQTGSPLICGGTIQSSGGGFITANGANLAQYGTTGGMILTAAAQGSQFYQIITNGPDPVYQWNGGGINEMTLNSSGALWIAGTLTQASDASLKERIEPIEGGLELVKLLMPKRFYWKDREADTDEHWGFIAQDVEPVIPAAVSAHEPSGILSLEETGIVAALVSAVKELASKVEELKSEVEGLKYERYSRRTREH